MGYQAAMGPYPYRELEILPVHYVAPVSGENRSGLILLNANWVSSPTQAWGMGAGVYARRTVLANELGHAWWGDLVWPDVLEAPLWLESITEAIGIATLEQAFGAEQADARRNDQVNSYRYARYIGIHDLPLGKPPTDPSQFRNYHAMSYSKPALFYDRVRRQVGDAAFFEALQRYVARERYSIRTDRGPIEELMSTPGMEELYRHWLLEAHGDEDLGVMTEAEAKQLGLKR